MALLDFLSDPSVAQQKPARPQQMDITSLLDLFKTLIDRQPAPANQLDIVREFRQPKQQIRRGMGGGVIDPATGKDPSNPFDNGFFKPSGLSPEARLAGGGNTAEAQWARMGQVDGVDPEKLRGLDAPLAQARQRGDWKAEQRGLVRPPSVQSTDPSAGWTSGMGKAYTPRLDDANGIDRLFRGVRPLSPIAGPQSFWATPYGPAGVRNRPQW